MDAPMETKPAGQPANKRRAKPASKPAAKGPNMSDRIPMNLKISRRAKMVLEAHATLWKGTDRGTCSAIVEAMIFESLKEIRISHHQAEAGQGAGDDAQGVKLAG